MPKYKKLTASEKWKIIEPNVKKEATVSSISKKTSISTSVINSWIRKYKESGIEGLEGGKSWKQYSSDLKIQAVEDVIIRGMSKLSVTTKYEISDASVLKRWIEWYNSEKELGSKKEK